MEPGLPVSACLNSMAPPISAASDWFLTGCHDLMKMSSPVRIAAFLGFLLLVACRAEAQLAPGVRGVATRAPKGMKIDGDLTPFKNAFCTPVDYFSFESKVLHERSAQFFYMWDDEAFYAGLR